MILYALNERLRTENNKNNNRYQHQHQQKTTNPKTSLTPRAQQSLEEKKKRQINRQLKNNKNDDTNGELITLMADIDIKHLLSNQKFQNEIFIIIRLSIKELYNSSPYQIYQNSRIHQKNQNQSVSKRGSSHPTENLIDRSNKMNGRHLPGGVGRRGPSIGIPPWQDRRGLIPSKYDEDIKKHHHPDQEVINDDDEEVDGGDDDEFVHVPQWKGREKAKQRTERSWKAADWTDF